MDEQPGRRQLVAWTLLLLVITTIAAFSHWRFHGHVAVVAGVALVAHVAWLVIGGASAAGENRTAPARAAPRSTCSVTQECDHDGERPQRLGAGGKPLGEAHQVTLVPELDDEPPQEADQSGRRGGPARGLRTGAGGRRRQASASQTARATKATAATAACAAGGGIQTPAQRSLLDAIGQFGERKGGDAHRRQPPTARASLPPGQAGRRAAAVPMWLTPTTTRAVVMTQRFGSPRPASALMVWVTGSKRSGRRAAARVQPPIRATGAATAGINARAGEEASG